MRIIFSPMPVSALTDLYERIPKSQLKTLNNIDRKKISIPALGSHLTRITGPMSRLTTIPSHTAAAADQNGAWNTKNTDKSIF
jgi:hypothetical protein